LRRLGFRLADRGHFLQGAGDTGERTRAPLGAAFIGRTDFGEHAIDGIETACHEPLNANGIRIA
jgi:hypothetical protein